MYCVIGEGGLLREYRTRLIVDLVTGSSDMRETHPIGKLEDSNNLADRGQALEGLSD